MQYVNFVKTANHTGPAFFIVAAHIQEQIRI